MHFEISSHKKLQDEIHDIISKDLQKILTDITNESLTSSKKVHQIRKMCKRQRGLLQMLKPILKDATHYKQHNSFYKTLAKNLATSRESKVMLDMFQLLIKNHALIQKEFVDIEDRLTSQNHDENFSKKQLDQKLQNAQEEIEKAIPNSQRLKLSSDDISSLKKGFRKTYQKAYNALNLALISSDIEDFHTFRKFAKYHMYHVNLLSRKSILPKSRSSELKELTDILGVEHDLHLFELYLIEHEKLLSSAKNLLPYLEKERKTLRKNAHKLEQTLFKLGAKKITQYAII